MSIATSKMLLTIVLIIWLMTLGRSVTIMIGGSDIFRKASRGEKGAIIPILNLFSMLEIVDISTYFGILFFVPVLNLFVLTAMSYKLGVVFKTKFSYKLGLVILPIIFYPLLGKSDKAYKVKDENFFRALDSVKNQSVNLMTQEEINEDVSKNLALDDDEDEVTNVDSVFKREQTVAQMEDEKYKASKIDLLDMNSEYNNDEKKDLSELLKPQEQIEKEKSKDDDLEMLDL